MKFTHSLLCVAALVVVVAVVPCMAQESSVTVPAMGAMTMNKFLDFAGRSVSLTSPDSPSLVYDVEKLTDVETLQRIADWIEDPQPETFKLGFTTAAEDTAEIFTRYCPTGVDCESQMLAFPVAVSYSVPLTNLGTIGDIVVSPQLIVWLWTGVVTHWSDPAISMLNPGITFPNASISLIYYDPDGAMDRVVEHILHRVVILASGGAPDPVASLAADKGLASDWAPGDIPPNAVLAASAEDAARLASRTPNSFTMLSAEDYGTEWQGELSPSRVKISTFEPVRLSHGAVFAEVETLDSQDISALVSGVEGSWPITYLEWIILPLDPVDVDPAVCSLMTHSLTGVYHLADSLFVADRSWDFGHAPFPFDVRELVVGDLDIIKCNGDYVMSHAAFVNGGGASVIDNLWLENVALFNALNGYNVRYETHGSGLDDLYAGIGIFAGADIPPTPDDVDDHPGLTVLPLVGMPLAFPYVIDWVGSPPSTLPDLVLTGELFAKIFMAQVTTWDDPEIVALNPELAPYLPNTTFCVFILSTESVGTLTLSKALSAFSSDWEDTYGTVTRVPPGFWPGEPIGSAGCVVRVPNLAEVAPAIARKGSAIGYTVHDLALGYGVSVASMVNAAGNVVKPGVHSAAAALADAPNKDPLDPELPMVKDHINSPNPDAWPVVSCSYIAFVDGGSEMCTELGVFGKLYSWLVTSPDAALSIYEHNLALPPNVSIAQTIEVVRSATCGGKLIIDPCDYTYCAPPSTPAPDASLSTGIIVVLAVAGVCLMGVVVGLIIYLNHRDVVFKLSVDEDLLIPLNEIEVTSSIGAGSFGTVYLIKWRGSPMAVKHMHALQDDQVKLAEFVDEAAVLMKLRHPNILLFMGITLDPAGLVTEYMPNGSLYGVLHDFDLNLEPNLVMWWAHCVALGLDFLQHAGIVHRDMKSLNVLLDAGYVPKICDFGLSASSDDGARAKASRAAARRRAKNLKRLRKKKHKHGHHGRSSRVSSANSFASDSSSFSSEFTLGSSASGGLNSHHMSTATSNALEGAPEGNLGSLLWAAPEILNDGPSAASQASDVFAFAVTLWEMVTRTEPYAGSNPVTIAVKVSLGTIRPSLEVIPEWAAFVTPLMTSAWAQNAKERPNFAHIATQLASRYVSAHIVLPRKTEVPSGRMIVARVSAAAVMPNLLENPMATRTALKLFHSTVAEATRDSRGTMGDYSLSEAVVMFQVASQFYSFATLVSEATDGAVPIKIVAAAGEVATQVSTGSDASDKQKTFAGPVISSLMQTWFESEVEAAPSGVFVASSLIADLNGVIRSTRDCDYVLDNEGTFAVFHPASKPSVLLKAMTEIIPPSVLTAPASAADKKKGTGASSSSSSSSSVYTSSSQLEGSSPKQDKEQWDMFDGDGLLSTSAVVSPGVSPGVSLSTLASPSGTPGISPRSPRLEVLSGSELDKAGSGSSTTRSRRAQHHSRDLRSLSLWTATAHPFLLSLTDMRDMVKRGVTTGMTSYSKVVVSTINHHRVCVKILVEQSVHTDALVNFGCGIANMARMAHTVGENIAIAPIGVCVVKPFIAAVFPFFENGSIADIMGDTGMAPETTKTILLSMASALSSMHSAGFVHGGIKPTNMLLDATSSGVVLSDAGLADIKSSMSTMTMSPSVSYMAPELLRGERESAAADIFSFASVMYEVLTGAHAFGGFNAMDVALKIRQGDLPNLDGIKSKRLVALLKSCWLVDPSQRPNMATILQSIQALPSADFE